MRNRPSFKQALHRRNLALKKFKKIETIYYNQKSKLKDLEDKVVSARNDIFDEPFERYVSLPRISFSGGDD